MTTDKEWIEQLKIEVFNRKHGNHHLSLEKVQSIYASFDEGNGIRRTAAQLGISTNTVKRYYRLGETKNCKCGASLLHQGWCSFRFERSPLRRAFITKWFQGRSPRIVRIKISKRELLNYPYMQNVPTVQGSDLVLLVNKSVPTNLPDQIRADVCQEILVSIISGEIGVIDIPNEMKRFIRETRKLNEKHYMAFSIDQPRRDGSSWHDVLSN